MKPALPVYIGQDMFKPKMNYWLIAGLVLMPIAVIGIYVYNKSQKPATNGSNTVQ